jgi:hypothetical protein
MYDVGEYGYVDVLDDSLYSTAQAASARLAIRSRDIATLGFFVGYESPSNHGCASGRFLIV